MLFNNSKYTTWYYNIINNAKSQQRIKTKENYYEQHHIIPKCLNGSNKKNNLVLLTAREHYLCHLLLPRMCINSQHRYKLSIAILRFKHNKNYSSKLYEIEKKRISKELSINRMGNKNSFYGKTHSIEQKEKWSELRKTQLGNQNGFYGKTHSDETKKLLKQARLGKEPWNKGKACPGMGNNFNKNMSIVQCPYCLTPGKGAVMKRWHFDNCKFKHKEETP